MSQTKKAFFSNTLTIKSGPIFRPAYTTSKQICTKLHKLLEQMPHSPDTYSLPLDTELCLPFLPISKFQVNIHGRRR